MDISPQLKTKMGELMFQITAAEAQLEGMSKELEAAKAEVEKYRDAFGDLPVEQADSVEG